MINIDRMTMEDVEQVLLLERTCFGEGWTSTPFDRELSREDCSYFLAKDNNTLIGYSGSWLILEELHVIIMAVHPDYRRKKIGQKLLIELINDGLKNNAKWVTLEVKVTNMEAQRLYEKFGFSVKGRRKNYYQQDRQDALIMWTDDIGTPEYQEKLAAIENELMKV